jgi:outer membrane protein TolC
MSAGGKFILCLAVMALMCFAATGPAVAEEASAPPEPQPATEEMAAPAEPEPAAEAAPMPAQPEPAVEERVIELTLADVVARALEANLDIEVERYNPDIRDAELLGAYGVFDPTIRLDYAYSDEEVPQTTREGLASNSGTTETITKDLSAVVEGKLRTGTEYSVLFDREQSQFTQRDTLVDPNPLVDGDEFIGDVRNPSEYNLELTFSVTQPLLKDFGLGPNLADIRIARGEKDMSIEDFRLRVMDVVAEAQSAYWNLKAAIANLRVTETSLAVAQDLLKDNRIRLKVGTMAPLEVVQAETGVAQREEQVIVAHSLIKDAEDNLKRILNLPQSVEEWKVRIYPIEEPRVTATNIDLLSHLNLAFAKRPDYRRSRMQIENDAINERFTRNQLLPTVDLNGEYTFLAVDMDLDEAFDDIERGTSPSWSLGATAEYPIGNRSAKGAHRKARLERMQSEKELENIRLSIIVEVNKAVRDIETSTKRIEVTAKAVDLAEQSLAAEQKKLRVGVSTSHDVLQFEEELVEARRRRILANLDHLKSLVNLSRATGTILEENSIVIEDTL